MPQLDIYSFSTQIYAIALFFFFGLLVMSNFLIRLFFRAELLEKEKNFFRSEVFLRNVETAYVNGLAHRLSYFVGDLYRSLVILI